jgi:hypothetical protein
VKHQHVERLHHAADKVLTTGRAGGTGHWYYGVGLRGGSASGVQKELRRHWRSPRHMGIRAHLETPEKPLLSALGPVARLQDTTV